MTRTILLVLLAVVAFGGLLATDAQAVYHPRLGRFLQRDPAGYGDGMNFYEYVGGAPTSLRDSHGLYAEAEFCCCEEIEITFLPNPPEWRKLFHAGGSWHFGFAMDVEFKVWGNCEKCEYRQDETGTVSSKGGFLTRPWEDPATGKRHPAGNAFSNNITLHSNPLDSERLAAEGCKYQDTPNGVYPDAVKGEVTMEMDFHVVISCTGTDGWTLTRTFDVTGSQKANRPSSTGSGKPTPPSLQPPTGDLKITPNPPAEGSHHDVVSP